MKFVLLQAHTHTQEIHKKFLREEPVLFSNVGSLVVAAAVCTSSAGECP